MSLIEALLPPETNQLEAYDTLVQMARRRTGKIPPELLARHVVDVYREADWPVKRAATEALLRRFNFARRDMLRIASAPARGKPFGRYQTRPRRGSARPYRTVLRSLAPLQGSCDCPDFLRSALGVCKHLLVVLDALGARPRKFQQALRGVAEAPDGRQAPLAWDPIRPLHGAGDWLERVRFRAGATRVPGEPERLRRARAHFVASGGGVAGLKNTWPDHPERRLTVVNDVLGLLTASKRNAESEPALCRLLADEQRRLELLIDARRGRRPSMSGLRRELYPYQREGVARFLDGERLLLADDMGLGKTVQAAAACHALYRAGRVHRGLVIVPASLKGQWEQEWCETTKVPVAVVEGPPAERAHAYRRTAAGFLIVNYEQVLRDLDEILAWDPQVVVLDEAQRIKNWATKTAAFVKRMRPRYRLVLTGTPMENRLEELASLMDWVDDHALEPKWRLIPWHSVFADGSREVVGARHLDTLRERVAPCMLRRVRSDVLSQLPPRTDSVIPVEMTAAQREEHDALDQPIASLLQRSHKRPLTQAEFLRLMVLLTSKRIIANGLALHRFVEIWPGIQRARPAEALLGSLSSPKLAETRALLAALAVEQERKVVVFSQWRRMLRLAHWAVADLLGDAGLRAAFFTGQEKTRQRTRNLVDFHDDPATRILFASDAGGVGLNLQRAASACVLLELPWNPAVLEQRVGRIYRLGQKRPIDVYSLVTQGSIEERIAALVADKRALFRGLFDGSSDSVRFDRSGSFLANLEKVVGAGAAARVGDDGEEADELADEEGVGEGLEAGLAADEDTDAVEEPATEAAGFAASARSPAGEGRSARPASRPVAVSDVAGLFAQLAVERTASGGLRVEAPPEAAETLASLFDGFAEVLRRAAR